MLQGDSLYDMVERSDLAVVKSNLDLQSDPSSGNSKIRTPLKMATGQHEKLELFVFGASFFLHSKSHSEQTLSSERSFVCCMRTSKAFKQQQQQQQGSCLGSMMVKGRFQYFPRPGQRSSPDLLPDQPLFVALCAPTVDRVPSCDSHLCQSFGSLHRLDMTFVQPSHRCVFRPITILRRNRITRCLLTTGFSQGLVRSGSRGGRVDGPVVVRSHPPRRSFLQRRVAQKIM